MARPQGPILSTTQKIQQRLQLLKPNHALGIRSEEPHLYQTLYGAQTGWLRGYRVHMHGGVIVIIPEEITPHASAD